MTKRRALLSLLAAGLLVFSASPVLAFDSGGTPTSTGPDTITWTGQGASGGAVSDVQCDAANDPLGENAGYLLWVFTTDGGSAKDATLHLAGTGTGTYSADTQQGSNFHFVTPYFKPDGSLTAWADFTVVDTGNGSWNLVISHGCPGSGPLAAAPTVTKTASPAFKRTYTWSIDKDVDKTLVKQVGGTATFTYTVTIGHAAPTDSGWKVTGEIKVLNPNPNDSITLDSVTDLVSDPNATCVVTGATGSGLVVAPGEKDYDYACTYSAAPATATETNTAKICWSDQQLATDGFLAGDCASSTPVSFTFDTPTLVDNCVTVTDPIDPNSPHQFCAGDAGDPTWQFQYQRTVPVPTWNCVTYDNTATFTTNTTATTGSASQTVKVCGPLKTGALTMGFWQNKNGQGIITSGASTLNVCNSGTWLRGYAPFQDLSATATCNQVAAYVTNVIKAANASGSSMNAMLKAQMLATALDVYFSNPALGGNKINAPAPIGGVMIDLTMIKAGGGYVDARSAFGGATSMSVANMLSFAASKSNVGGSMWYGNVKAVQELAKDAFDAINNQVAFAP